MDFEDWDVYYRRILTDFGYSREEDERSARILRVGPGAKEPALFGIPCRK